MPVIVTGVFVGMNVNGAGVAVTVDMDEIMRLKEGCIIQYFAGSSGADDPFIIAEYTHRIRYLFHCMQIVGRGYDRLTSLVLIEQ